MNNNRYQSNGRAGQQGQNIPPRQARAAQSARAPQNAAKPARQVKPNAAKAQTKNVKNKLTPEQVAINRQNRERERYYAKKRRAASLRLLAIRFLLFVAVLGLMTALTVGIFYLNLVHVDSEDSSRYSYTIGEDKYTVPFSEAVRDGRIYVSFTDIAQMCDLALTGSQDDLKYVIKGDEAETIRFITDSRVVYVNGVEARLGAECYYEDGELYVPVNFVEAYFKGLQTEINEDKHEISISRIITNLNEKGKLPKGTKPEYAALSFLLQSAQAISPLDEEAESMAQMPDLGFVTNLTIYEQYMNPGNTDEFLILVSPKSTLDSTYIPQDLYMVEATRNDGRAKQQLRLNAAMSLEALFKEMVAAGYDDVSVTSAYRSYSYQEQLFNQYLRENNNDYEYVATFSNPPGSSEHQTGLCVDMHNLTSASKVFAEKEAYKWLKENCWKFGYILRYPEDKTEITGISFEPWHYRYVGRYHAQRMHESNMCLEEYIAHIGGVN